MGCGGPQGFAGCGALGFELAYFNLDGWHDKKTLTGDLTLFDLTDLGTNATAIVKYESRLQSLEANVYRPYTCWSKLIAGVRWMQLHEASAVSGVGPLASDARAINLTNNFYGAHVGMQRLLFDNGGCLTVDGLVKGGVFANDISRKVTGFGSPTLDTMAVSFIGDIQLQANFEVTCNWSVTAGYQMLFVTGAAEAPKQYNMPTEINHGSFIFYHGANVGMAYTF